MSSQGEVSSSLDKVPRVSARVSVFVYNPPLRKRLTRSLCIRYFHARACSRRKIKQHSTFLSRREPHRDRVGTQCALSSAVRSCHRSFLRVSPSPNHGDHPFGGRHLRILSQPAYVVGLYKTHHAHSVFGRLLER